MGRTPIDRRHFLGTTGLALGAGGLTWAVAGTALGRVGRPGGPVARRAYIGGFTEGEFGLPDLPGIGLATVDGRTGALSLDGYFRGIDNPTYLALSPRRDVLYAVGQTARGTVHALSIDRRGRLSPINQRPTEGSTPVHLAIDPTGRYLVTVNYDSGGVAVHPLRGDGGLGPLADLAEQTGSGPHPVEQRGPHPHMVAFGTSGDVLVPDKGDDHVYVYGLDPATGRLTLRARSFIGRGVGPRHLAFHPSGRIVYVVNELGHTVAICGYDPRTARLAVLGWASVVPPGVDPRNAPSGVRISPDGRLLFAADRGLDTVTVYRVRDAGRTLRVVESQPVTAKAPGSRWPRDIVLDRSGEFLYAASEKGQSVTALRVAPGTGRLDPVGAPLRIASPSCVVLR
ncbi:6-phosphogluconolactonase, cycloisomerase 2 family [Thermomonospora echinospora]|uniref:6-phosphogluconolactonase, cycloisomerase 2 family n=1 Tax=Thermomonospora echinospora TaxID=1992 RepID=A0A1H5VEW0_9ACTN|nr:lactonase family protein [Thermomonospora echinospora]SEF85803.1 6-phosphogluconolactonase, cycloisomerase 2 family [Thermomonospora echinospora]